MRCLSALLCVLHLSVPAQALTPRVIWQGKVIKVPDGDTLAVLHPTLQRTVKIRLHSVDAPEKDQPYGQQAAAFTSKLVLGKVVDVQVVTTDKYGRTVAHVLVGGRNLGELLLQAGLAWHYKHYSRDARLAALEADARRRKTGLWADANPTAPWDHRRTKRGNKSTPVRAPGSQGPGTLHGNVRSRVYHGPNCDAYNCKHCTRAFDNPQAAQHAGFRPCPRCQRPAADQACHKASDCVIEPTPPCTCRCPSRAINTAAAARLRASWGSPRCGRIYCRPCYTRVNLTCKSGRCVLP